MSTAELVAIGTAAAGAAGLFLRVGRVLEHVARLQVDLSDVRVRTERMSLDLAQFRALCPRCGDPDRD